MTSTPTPVQEKREKALMKMREYGVANKEKIRARKKAYNLANAERLAAERVAYLERNRDRFIEYRKNRAGERAVKRRIYNQANRDKIRYQTKEYNDKNRAKILAQCKEYYRLNKAKVLVKTHRRKALVKSLLHPDHCQQKERELFDQCISITNGTGIIHQVDHIIPIAAGGYHHHDNLQILPRTTNIVKYDDPFWEMPGYKSWRDVPEYLWPEKLVPAYRAIIQKEHPVPQN